MKILFITAHCDDAELWAGGTICKYISNGCEVYNTVFIHDDIRREEAIKGASILGSQPIFCDLKTEKVEWLVETINRIKPEVLFTHQNNDPHHEHSNIFKLTERALTASKNRKKFPLRWYCYDTYYATQLHVIFPIVIDISKYYKQKCNALKCHVSQNPEELENMALHMNALHGMKIRVKYAEAFYPFSLLGRWPLLRKLP